MRRKFVMLRTKHDGTPRTKGPQIKDEVEFQELSRMIESGNVDADRIQASLKKGSASMNSPNPHAKRSLKVILPLLLYRAFKAKCAVEGVSPEAKLEEFVMQFVEGKIPPARQAE